MASKLCCACAILPSLGILPPAAIFSDGEDFRHLIVSKAVINRAIDDWHFFLGERAPIEIAINLPIAFLRQQETYDYLCGQLSDIENFDGFIVEVDSLGLPAAVELAKTLRCRKIAISVDDVAAD